ncbi:PREDICTED: uncharacterized protein LOC106804686 [Priapulus caudatus]|uniref:Uncharacterized protein LOC106804686 n=1 Tax=Priapulus caudatus TaxID=37621 RepID=A0ABM1DNC8_PRICU|nr:PREDICTED: uncharacterized protein LOC106804686 [Priapulus caudatus]
MELTLRFCLLVLLPCVLAQFGPDVGYSGGLQISRADLNAAIDRARQLVEALEEYEKNIFDSGIWARPGSSASFVAAFAKASIESKLLSKGAIVALETTKALARGYRLTTARTLV